MGLWAWLFGQKPDRDLPQGDEREKMAPLDFSALKKAYMPARMPSKQVMHLEGDGSFDFDIVGESRYQANLARIAGPKTEDGHDHDCMALLVPEPENPHDANAIRVDINGLTVGYISRDLAKGMARIFRKSTVVGAISADAKIVGGWYRPRNGSEGSYGVKLDIFFDE